MNMLLNKCGSDKFYISSNVNAVHHTYSVTLLKIHGRGTFKMLLCGLYLSSCTSNPPPPSLHSRAFAGVCCQLRFMFAFWKCCCQQHTCTGQMALWQSAAAQSTYHCSNTDGVFLSHLLTEPHSFPVGLILIYSLSCLQFA